ncbi:hypothetical protein AAA501_31705 [Pseudomonas aeruginosa]|uniref:hypothetical protein n=1 Tax=Pseudomonas aeruginosa TaxID=287 RepID=UPI00038F606F|nr:hypothetical protein [Pseudomonas aeruginosa]EQM83995.1 hypothetical protein L683_24410 [Pseudomonas aeruginosa WC55]MBB4848992.1 hypothetical protein [Pseudomonas aeruginosa]MBW0950722.1 hypothetical protein [Pseudomonas aeruginosa]RQB60064.1 hypothetical protein IPC446_02720 [Pseudomonas aeruginosa]HBN9568134.1 hypothetical protein [Pseudomonas aeruginosa]
MSAETPRERPILFNDQMVRAILDGRKTVTRRIVKPQPSLPTTHWWPSNGRGPQWMADGPSEATGGTRQTWGWKECPFGQPGDRLWVREAWGVISNTWDESGNMVDWTPDRPATPIRDLPFGSGYYSGHAIYAADGPMEWAGDDDGGGESRSAWKPSIHMPRAISRILLEITAVRVERLQDISEEQARAEGYPAERECETGGSGLDAWLWFRSLWGEINGPEAFAANPWVWVVEFKRVTP